jgi:hypothetical protein
MNAPATQQFAGRDVRAGVCHCGCLPPVCGNNCRAPQLAGSHLNIIGAIVFAPATQQFVGSVIQVVDCHCFCLPALREKNCQAPQLAGAHLNIIGPLCVPWQPSSSKQQLLHRQYNIIPSDDVLAHCPPCPRHMDSFIYRIHSSNTPLTIHLTTYQRHGPKRITTLQFTTMSRTARV